MEINIANQLPSFCLLDRANGGVKVIFLELLMALSSLYCAILEWRLNVMRVSKENKVLISQADNYAGNFGKVLRSSAIFWVKNSRHLTTTISFSNYWKYKNFTDVTIVLNLRMMSGKLVSRQTISFDETMVCNYSPPKDFEGSVEVEAFSIKNIRIPYAAVMAVYESTGSISMVHSYARAYSQHEIEEKRTLSVGEESCWTLRDSAHITSFAVIHNGPTKQESQSVQLSIRNSEGKELATTVAFEALEPFETKIIEPKEHFQNLVEWLDGLPGNGRMSFNLSGGFTRMLCAVKKNDDSELQVTHSNFDYSSHSTDTITEGILRAYMRTPNVNSGTNQEIVVYPDTDTGEYNLIANEEIRKFSTGTIQRLIYNTSNGQLVEFSRKDNILPTRIVTALRLNSKKSKLPAECSMGVVHHTRPNKHFHWMIASLKFNSEICWVDFQEVYGGCPNDAELVFKLYSPNSTDVFIRNLKKQDLPNEHLFNLNEIFDDLPSTEDFLYLTCWSSYGGFMFFSTMNKNESITIEHSF